uniref:(northern house mosquito) hypothetical protein n=1 Tax=Culex pipiens TaxID=7175 RepID=A0A8D8FKB6_CULPI
MKTTTMPRCSERRLFLRCNLRRKARNAAGPTGRTKKTRKMSCGPSTRNGWPGFGSTKRKRPSRRSAPPSRRNRSFPLFRRTTWSTGSTRRACSKSPSKSSRRWPRSASC